MRCPYHENYLEGDCLPCRVKDKEKADFHVWAIEVDGSRTWNHIYFNQADANRQAEGMARSLKAVCNCIDETQKQVCRDRWEGIRVVKVKVH